MALARTLKITVACEGVETTEQAEFLREAGSNLLQGHLFAKPMPLADVVIVAGVRPRAAASMGDQPRAVA